jgi:hypothetical protein
LRLLEQFDALALPSNERRGGQPGNTAANHECIIGFIRLHPLVSFQTVIVFSTTTRLAGPKGYTSNNFIPNLPQGFAAVSMVQITSTFMSGKPISLRIK